MESQFKPNKIEKLTSSKLELYKLALQKEMNEGQIMWQSSQGFLIANTIIFGFISQIIFKNDKQINFTPNFGIFSLAFLGFIVCILWLGTYMRRSNYYKFRMAQARQREPKDWYLVKDEGRFFAEGDTIEIEGEKYNLGIGRIFKTSHIIIVFISLFMLMYFIFLIIAFPWRNNC